MIEQIREAIVQGEFETDVYLQFTKFQLEEECLYLTCSIFLKQFDSGLLVDQWLIKCLNWEDYRIEHFISYEQEEFEMTDEYPCLWDYQTRYQSYILEGK